MSYQPQRQSYGRPQQNFRRQRPAYNPRYFDPSHLVRKATPVEETVYVPKNLFTDFALCDQLQKNIVAHGYTSPTQIQDEAIPVLLEGKDVVGLANTGTGKTAAFLLPLINKVFKDRNQRVLILAPTRELAVQIEQEFKLLSRGMGIYSALCIGGVSMYGQVKNIQRGPNFVIGTPGRLKDLENQGVISFGACNNIVLDEVDQMLDMGFINDIRHITSLLPKERHSLFFSATMTPNVQTVMHQLLQDPVRISVKTRETAANIDQDVIKTNGRMKIDILHELLTQVEFQKVLVFLRTKHGAEKLSTALDQRGIRAVAVHGNKSQSQRQRALDSFKSNYVQVMIATDVASRGLDIDDVSHVINFDLPESYEDYIHRIGRTGRANKKGIAISLVD